MTYLELILYLQAEMAKSEQTALAQPEQEPTVWRDMVVVSLVREGINKHKARELADHFAAQRLWQGLTWEDMPDTHAGDSNFLSGARWAETKLKERNHG